MDEENTKAKSKAEAQPLPAKAADPEPVKLTPEQWAEKLGQVRKAPQHQPQLRTHYAWQHAAASSLHGWEQHAHHYQNAPLLLTQADYQAALDAAAEYPAKPAHAAALSPVMKGKI